MKAIWKFGPFFPGETKKAMGRPLYAGIQDEKLFIWTEVDPSWASLENTKDNGKLVEWCDICFVPTGAEYSGEYIGTVQEIVRDHALVWHAIKVG